MLYAHYINIIYQYKTHMWTGKSISNKTGATANPLVTPGNRSIFNEL